MLFFSNSKINLGLNIVSKRTDGFHNLQSIFYPIPFGDCIEFITTKGKGDMKLSISGMEIPGDPSQNLLTKTYKLLHEEFDLPSIEVFLLKRVPLGAGIGGGSSDAAMFLKALNEYFKLGLNTEELKSRALQLGSDCPFFIESKPCHVTGRGEILSPISLDLSGKYIVLLNPKVHISTAESFANIEPHPNSSTLDLVTQDFGKISEWKNFLSNDFEDHAFQKFPILEKLKTGLYESGAQFALMSGSGSTVYGIFKKEISLPQELEEHLIWSGEI